jgi:hypothetical protein
LRLKQAEVERDLFRKQADDFPKLKQKCTELEQQLKEKTSELNKLYTDKAEYDS